MGTWDFSGEKWLYWTGFIGITSSSVGFILSTGLPQIVMWFLAVILCSILLKMLNPQDYQINGFWRKSAIVCGNIVLLLMGLYLLYLVSNTSTNENNDQLLTTPPQNSNPKVQQPYFPVNKIQPYCGDGICNNGETCNACPQDCGQCTVQKTVTYTPQSLNIQEQYDSNFCDKINPYDLSVREAAVKAIRNDPGGYSVAQLFDVYDWVKDNIIYQNVPLAGIPYPAKDTLATGSGDCKNQAVLIASMIEAISGKAEVVAAPSCKHAYTIVLVGSAGDDLNGFIDAVAKHYGANVQVNYFTYKGGIWVIFDPAGGRYPGNTLPECSGSKTFYPVETCMSCVNQYPNSPYTYLDKCYSQCPQGTISINDYACSPCPSGYWSYNNKCVTCQSGYSLHTDGRCYPN